MVVIQEKTEKVLVVYETKKKYWFFPRGRKDLGETLEQAALREAYEEVCSEIARNCVLSLCVLIFFVVVGLSRRLPPATALTSPAPSSRNKSRRG